MAEFKPPGAPLTWLFTTVTCDVGFLTVFAFSVLIGDHFKKTLMRAGI